MASMYTYKVRDAKSGKVIDGELEGSSKEAVIRALKESGMTPLGVAEKKTDGLQKEISIPGITDRIKAKEIAIFSRQFATMINSGLSLLRSLYVLEEQTVSKPLKKTIGEVRASVERGASLSVALEQHPKVFNTLFVAMVQAGEAAGVLDETLERIADTLESAAALRSKIKSAMAYPIVVLSMVAGVVTLMLLFVVPQFVDMYADVGGELPIATRALIGASGVLTSKWYIIFPAFGASVYAFRRWINTTGGRRMWDAFKLRAPVFGTMNHKTAISRFARTLGVLVRSGVPILEAMTIVELTAGNVVVGDAVNRVAQAVKGGDSISQPLAKEGKIFPPMVVQMMAVGEETGALDNMLDKVSDFYDREVNDTVDALTSLLEPILIAFMGATVGAILVALYLPMFNLVNVIG